MFKQHIKLITFVFILLTIFNSGCTLYYTTSEIDKSLSDMVDAIKLNYEMVNDGFSKMEKEYNKLRYSGEEEPYLSAYNMLKKLEMSFGRVSQLKIEVDNEYKGFKNYSRGVSKIASNSQEWTHLKQTKKKMKLLKKDLQKEGESFIKLAESFQEYINIQVAPLIKIYKVSDYEKKNLKILSSLKKLNSEVKAGLKNYKAIQLDLDKKYAIKYPVKCQELKLKLESIITSLNMIVEAEKNLKARMKEFYDLTNKFSELYNTYPEWEQIQKKDNEINAKTNEIQSIQKEIKEKFNDFQSIANELKLHE